MYDLLIRNASILDGTGANAFDGSIAVQDGQITALGADLSGEALRVIDASGLTVSPGWIDSHSHSDRTFFSHPAQKEKVEQGITFSITGQCGGSSFPRQTENGVENVAELLVQAGPQGSGAALLIGHGTLRTIVMGKENREPTADELEEMKALLREALRADAIGLSYGLTYIPGCYAKTEELVALAQVVKEYDGILAIHLRNEGDFLLESVEEFLAIVRASGCRGVFSHHKAMHRPNWGKSEKSLALIDQAVSEGLDVYLDVYPYCASSTTMLARYVPTQFHPPGTQNAVALLDDPVIYRQLLRWGEENWANDLSWTLVTNCPGHPEYAGLNLNEISDLRGEPNRMSTALELIRESSGGVSACFFSMCEEDLTRILRHPRAMICTDSAVAGDSRIYHPRLRASFPRVLARYVREQGIVTLPEMIRRMTSLPAHVYGLSAKGLIKEGMDADLCIFDAERIRDTADFVHCTAPNEGLRYVIIGGEIAAENGGSTGVLAGRIEEKPHS